MKRSSRGPSERQLAGFPLRGLVDGWFFRQDEVAPGNYLVDGIDCWGRGMRLEGSDPDALLDEAVCAAREMQHQLDGNTGE
jgi:hypothetical protein